jgi:hypothetical protein
MTILSTDKKVIPESLHSDVLLALCQMETDKNLDGMKDIEPWMMQKIREMSPVEALNSYLIYIGIQGYTEKILAVIGNLQDASV